VDGGVSIGAAPTRGDFSLSGSVVNSVTGEPIAHALVQINLGSESVMLTESDGRFKFDNLPQGQTIVAVRKPGFLSEAEISPGQPPNLVETGPDSRPVIVKLIPEGIVLGRVDSKGEPLEGLPIKIIAPAIAEGRKRWDERGAAVTGEDGAYRIANLSPGTYYIAAGPSLRRIIFNSSKLSQHGYAEEFYPAATDLGGAMPLEVSAGQQVEADFSLKPVPLYHISGVVPWFEPGNGVALRVVNETEVTWLETRFDDRTGEFQATAPAGAYVLQAQSTGPNRQMLMAELPLNLTSDLSGIRLQLLPLASIPIHVKVEKLAPETPERRGSARRQSDNVVPMNARLIAADLSLSNREVGATPIQWPGSPPGLEFQNAEPGKYSLDLGPNFPWYVYSARSGDTNLLTSDLQVVAGVQPEPIDVVLRDDAATLSAKVSSQGQPSRGFVLVIPDGAPRLTRPMFVPEGAEGEAAGLAPGEYNVLALDRADGIEYTNPEVLSRYLSNANTKHVVLLPNQKIELNLDLVRVSE
jgi:Carboxypeptidase regulatory-like domain